MHVAIRVARPSSIFIVPYEMHCSDTHVRTACPHVPISIGGRGARIGEYVVRLDDALFGRLALPRTLHACALASVTMLRFTYRSSVFMPGPYAYVLNLVSYVYLYGSIGYNKKTEKGHSLKKN